MWKKINASRTIIYFYFHFHFHFHLGLVSLFFISVAGFSLRFHLRFLSNWQNPPRFPEIFSTRITGPLVKFHEKAHISVFWKSSRKIHRIRRISFPRYFLFGRFLVDSHFRENGKYSTRCQNLLKILWTPKSTEKGTSSWKDL